MATEHLQPGVVTHLPLGPALGESATTAFVKTASFELIRMVLPAGREIPPHKTRGEITVQCLEGRVLFSCYGETVDLRPGDLLYLAADDVHALKAVEPSSLLVSLVLAKDRSRSGD
ncbi:MAG: cupin domain-containing protein [Planctomyces sp.]|nr:cupin domain-containing protein [Planctomyces sp.]